MQTNEQTAQREAGSSPAPCSAVFDSETVEAALKRTEATACAMKEPDCSDVLAAEVRKLRTALKDANDLCRSAYQVAIREGRETNWPAFRDCLSESLDRQHRVMYPPIDPSSATRPDTPETLRCWRDGKWHADELANLAAKFERALRRIQGFSVHSEPVGGAYAMQDIAHETLSPFAPLTG